MAKNKTSEIPHYEILYIISNKYTEDELKPIIKEVEAYIENNSGKITYREDWGKKKFTYQIKNFQFGYYQLAEFDMPGEKLSALNRALRLSRQVLRYQIVIKESQTVEEKRLEKDRLDKIAREAILQEREEEEEKIKSPEKKKDEKVDIKQLDEKLNKILDTDDLF